MCSSVEQAQAAGYRDGASGQPSQVNWFMTACSPATREAVAGSYHEAHVRGFAEFQANVARNAEAQRQAQARAAEAAREAEAAHLTRLCTDPSAAFQAGFNAGYQRQTMSADWADRYCAAAYRTSTKDKYIAGYQSGIAQAPAPPPPPPVQPVIVVAPRSGRAAASTFQDSCTFSSDCGDGQSCRHVAQLGRSVCMGDGLRGDYCWFDSDCLSDRCQLRSGGAKTCK